MSEANMTARIASANWTPAEGRLPSLTGLRFAAAFLVMGFHLLVAGFLDDNPAGPVMRLLFGQGAVGVSFFFILSGFVLTWSAQTGDTPGRFWQRRFARIYPNHAVTWMAALAVGLVTGPGASLAVALPNLVLIQAWFPDPAIYYGMNTVAWSLACEAFFYALFPLLSRGLHRLRTRMLWPATAMALALVLVLPLLVQPIPPAQRYWAIWLFPVARLPEFVAGMVLARIVRDRLWPPVGLGLATAVTATAYLVSRWLPADLRIVAGTVIPFVLLIGAAAQADLSGRRTIWSHPRMVLLGEISYAFYLVHQLVIRLVAIMWDTDGSLVTQLGLSLVAIALALAVSWALYRAVEVPANRFLRPRRARHRVGVLRPGRTI